MQDRLLIADVGLDSRSAGSEAVYAYLAPPDAAPGQAWFVPLGPRRALGFILTIRSVTETELGFPADRLKPMTARVMGLDLPERAVDLIQWVAMEYLSRPSVALGLALPPGLRDQLATRWTRTDRPATDDLTPAMKEALSVLEQGELWETKAKPIPKGVQAALRALAARRLVDRTLALRPTREVSRYSGLLRLTSDAAKVDRFLTKDGKKRPAQAVTLMRLQGSESASFSPQEVKALGGVTDQTIKALVTAGLLEEVDESFGQGASPPEPNPFQATAIEQIFAAIEASRRESFLLFGVTGSGKTEVYLRAAAEALKWGRQVLYLVPEIALTAQVVAQLRARFGRSVAVIHSNMNPTERLESWMRVRSGEAPVALGARSALFAPFSNLGLIVMDEEHEGSYKQEVAPRYHAKAVALKLAETHSCPVVFGSATPSIETSLQARLGEITLLELPHRAAQAQLPEVMIEDLRSGYQQGKPSILSPKLQELLSEALMDGHQAILFLNRRAYSPFLLCRECGHRWTCPNCAVTLSYHRQENRLRCHHCDHRESPPDLCPACDGTKIKPIGVGAEKVEEEVQKAFPSLRVARLDRDVARKKGALEEILAKFRSQEIHVLVGTQMVAKGLDFPNVTLVGVISADISLNVPDFRASERTYQLLSQVAGRAGRGQHPGRVVIQTFNPANSAILAAKDHDFERIYQELRAEREIAGYPPFRRLVNLIVMGPAKGEVEDIIGRAAKRLVDAMPDAEVLGPTDCPMERLNGLYRQHLLVKLPPKSTAAPISDCLDGLETKTTRIIVDVDPQSLI